MSERALPTVDGAPACPFVAFDDDRDGRAQAPDHRHRCFAEPRPAPRALAHQEAYCLSSAFPVCPAFQDWARREAAAARPAAASAVAAASSVAGEEIRDVPQASAPVSPREPDPRPVADPVPAAAKRTPQRDWAAPPPWIAEAEEQASSDGSLYRAGDPYDDIPQIDDVRYTGDGDLGPLPAEEPVAPPSFLAAKSSTPNDPSRGLAGSPADRLAGSDPYAPRPAADPYRQPAPPPSSTGRDDLDDWAGPGTAAVAAAATVRPASSRQRYEAQRAGPGRAAAPSSRREPASRAGKPDQAAKGAQPDPQELFGPAWEPARRYEAYPSLKTRIGLPSIGRIPPLGVAVIALVLAAGALFFVGPFLLGLGGKDAGTGASPAPVATEAITAEPDPTPIPAPTPQVYVIAKGDTMSKIAKKFGVTVEEILAANKKIKNPDKIKVGQEITIPVPAAEDVVDQPVDDGTVQDSAAP